MEDGVDHLAFERNKAQFDVEDMKIIWAGSRQDFELSDRISRLVASDPVNSPLSFFNFTIPFLNFVEVILVLCFSESEFIYKKKHDFLRRLCLNKFINKH